MTSATPFITAASIAATLHLAVAAAAAPISPTAGTTTVRALTFKRFSLEWLTGGEDRIPQ